MSIIDVLKESIQTAPLKTAGGDAILPGFTTAIVVGGDPIYDEEKHPGKVKVQFLNRTNEKNLVEWVPVVMPAGGKEHGLFFLPEVGDLVLVGFGDGNFNRPYILGCLYKANSKLLTNTVDKENNLKKIQTRGGNQIIFCDEVEISPPSKPPDASSDTTAEGPSNQKGKEYIKIITKKNLMICIENEDEVITICDENKKNRIVLDSKNNEITIRADAKVRIMAGDNASILMDASDNSMVIKADTIQLKAQKDLLLQAANLKANAQSSLKLNGDSSSELSSGGTTKVGGATIKLG